jgi:hypothetical protein
MEKWRRRDQPAVQSIAGSSMVCPKLVRARFFAENWIRSIKEKIQLLAEKASILLTQG